MHVVQNFEVSGGKVTLYFMEVVSLSHTQLMYPVECQYDVFKVTTTTVNFVL